MAVFRNSVTAPSVTIEDLEDPIRRSLDTARIIDLLLNHILDRAPVKQGSGVILMALDEHDIGAIQHAKGQLMVAVQEASEAWEKAYAKMG